MLCDICGRRHGVFNKGWCVGEDRSDKPTEKGGESVSDLVEIMIKARGFRIGAKDNASS